jgi:aryl-alcohol dehydrogenase-like predicted oxidoreductase
MSSRRVKLGPFSIYPLGIGCMGMSEYYGPADETESLLTLEMAIERGVDFFDTADAYGRGANEILLTRALKSHRSQIVVATKGGIHRRDTFNPRYINNTPEYLSTAVEGSLKRLGIETIDLYYLHRIDSEVPIEESVGALGTMVEAGKIRAIGLSEVPPSLIRRAHAVHPVAAVQSEYSLWTREVEAEVLPVCRKLGIRFVAYSPLGRGFFVNHPTRTDRLAEDDYRRQIPRLNGGNFEENLILLAPVAELARAKGVTVTQIALAWLIGREVVPIPGIRKRHHLNEDLGALDVSLSAEEVGELDCHFTAHPAKGGRYGEAALRTIAGIFEPE